LIDQSAARKQAEALIEQYDIRCEGAEAQTGLLSGGNIQKLILARSLSTQPKFILANQPVRGLDEGAIAYVQSQILAAKEQGAGVLLISEDLDELFEIADKIAVVFHGALQGPFSVDEIELGQIGLMMSGESFSRGSARVENQAQP
jgi:simple sugar transport system ATP-binding protein